jgi:hypothetical protein
MSCSVLFSSHGAAAQLEHWDGTQEWEGIMNCNTFDDGLIYISFVYIRLSCCHLVACHGGSSGQYNTHLQP